MLEAWKARSARSSLIQKDVSKERTIKPTLRIVAIILALSNLTSFGHAQTIEKKSLTIDGAKKVIAAAVASRQSTRTIWPGAMPTARRFIFARVRVFIECV